MAHLRRRWWVLGGGAAAVLVVVGVLVVLFVLRDQPGAKPVGEAVDEFRQGGGGAGGGSGPEPGVYQATGEGIEKLSVPPISQHDGDVIPVTVTDLGDGCFRLRVDHNEAHWQDWTLCHDEAGVLADHGGQTFQRWDIGATTIDNTSTFTCDPPAVLADPAAAPGDTWDHRCSGTNTQSDGVTHSDGTHTLVGAEDLQIDGQAVPTRHYREQRTISGAQQGREQVDVWFAADHLPVRMARDVHIDSDSPVGTVTYTETGSWQLTSLTPTR